MPRGTRIPPAERRDWLDKYERGDRVDKIAREAGRTERTVQSHLSRERRERDHQQVMAGLLRDAYQNHYVQLLNQKQYPRHDAALHFPRKCPKIVEHQWRVVNNPELDLPSFPVEPR